MVFVLSVLVAASCLMIGYHCWKPFFEEGEGYSEGWFLRWLVKGALAPALVWLLLNCGIAPRISFFMPQIGYAKSAGRNWFIVLADSVGAGWLVIASFWAALSLCWLFPIMWRRVPEENRGRFKAQAILWSLFLAPVSAMILHASGWMFAGVAVVLWLLPIAHFAAPLLLIKKELPHYSGAIAKMKFGKLAEAEWEVIEQLEKCQDDFEGWMLLADLYASYFHELEVADRTIQELCEQPNLNASQIAIALHRLADWHLKFGNDPYPARRALLQICHRFPGTHLARMAQQRINQLPASGQELMQQRAVKTIRLHTDAELQETLATTGVVSKQDAALAANQCAEKLRKDPNDVAAREKLARLFAEQLEKPELGIEQLQLLVDMSNQSPQKMAQWLELMASWLMKFQNDPDTARYCLERLIREFPQTAQAFHAQRRLKLMEIERTMRAFRAQQ